MASAEAWSLLQKFRSEWVGRKRDPADEDWAELLDEALERGGDAEWMDGEE